MVATIVTIVMVSVMLLSTVAIALVLGVGVLNRFAHASDLSTSELLSYGVAGLTRQPQQHQGRVTFLVLGLDELSTRGDAPVLSDTIMLLSLKLADGTLAAVSLPRDLWLEDYQTKINSLYWYGQERFPDRPETFPEQVISDLVALPIDHTLIVTMNQLAELVDLVGGIEVTITEGFTDPLFPRPDVDVTVEKDPEVLYKTVTFESGTQVLNGERALEYVRSRKSTGTQGSDDARALRQQQVIAALMHQLSQPSTVTNTTVASSLLKFYQTNYATQLPLSEVLAIGRVIFPFRDQLTLQGQGLSVAPADPQGVLTHPPESRYNGQWVYTYRSLPALQHEIKTKLALPTTQ